MTELRVPAYSSAEGAMVEASPDEARREGGLRELLWLGPRLARLIARLARDPRAALPACPLDTATT